jgi:hypothetical protein
VLRELIPIDPDFVASSTFGEIVTFVRSGDPQILTASLRFFNALFDHGLSNKVGLVNLIVALLPPLIESQESEAVLHAISLLFGSFVQSGIAIPALPGGVESYNLMLRCPIPAILYRVLHTLTAILRGDGPEIDVVGTRLDWAMMNDVLKHEDPTVVCQCIICFSNIAKCGEEFCRRLVEIGVLHSLSCIMAEGACELKVAAVECFCEFLLVSDLCEPIVLESDFLAALTDIIAGMNELTIALTLPKLQTAMEYVIAQGKGDMLVAKLGETGLIDALLALTTKDELEETEATEAMAEFLGAICREGEA